MLYRTNPALVPGFFVNGPGIIGICAAVEIESYMFFGGFPAKWL